MPEVAGDGGPAVGEPQTGALVALLLAHLDFSIIALIGVILLLGIVKKNAIMMIDFALEAERRAPAAPAGRTRDRSPAS